MTTHHLVSAGLECFPVFTDLTEARRVLRELIADDVATVRRRYGQATKVKNGEDNYSVFIGCAQSVSMWSSRAIVTYR